MDDKSAQKKSDDGARVESLLALAARLSPAGDSERGKVEWSPDQANACMTMVGAALRMKSSERLEEALGLFGGLPPPSQDRGGWNLGHVLDMAASAHDAFGFDRLLGEHQRVAEGLEVFEGASGSGGEGGGLGGWLRSGLFNSYYGFGSKKLDVNEAKCVGIHVKPVAACFARDNPMALAMLLSDPRRMAALAALEPRPMAEPLDWAALVGYGKAEAPLDAARSADAGFEKSLLWQAVSMGALRCAGLLASLPEFSAPLLKSEGFGALSDATHWFERPAGSVFHEEGEPPFHFFEWAMGAAHGHGGCGVSDREAFKKAGRAMAEAMVEAGGDAARSFEHPGTGMGWPEMYFAACSPHRWGSSHNEFAQAEIGDAMRMLGIFEAKGFKPQWGAMAGACGECRVLADWMELRGESAGAPPPGAGKPRRLAL